MKLIVGELDLKIDLSKEGIYTLTDQTQKIVNDVEDEVVLYYIVQDGQEDTQIEQIINKYKGITSNVSLVKKDPLIYPNFTSQYVDSTETVEDNSIIVVNKTKDRYNYVPYSDMFVSELNSSTYEQEVTAIDAEGQITSAIQYVVSETLPKIYTVEGHGEAAIGETLASAIKKENITTETLNTLTKDSIPEDCDVLMMNGPTSDYSDAEAMINAYLQNGGKAIILTTYTTEKMSNFNGILDYYVVTVEEGIICEDSSHSMSGYVTYVLPDIQSHDITTSIVSSNKPVLLVQALGLSEAEDKRTTVEIAPILTSSDASYSKVNVDSSTADKEEGDVDGPFNLGLLVSETYDSAETEIIVYSSSFMIDDQIVSEGFVCNTELFLNSVNYITDKETGLSIPSRSLAASTIMVSGSQIGFWTVLLVIIIPLIILITGLVIWLRRRKK